MKKAFLFIGIFLFLTTAKANDETDVETANPENAEYELISPDYNPSHSFITPHKIKNDGPQKGMKVFIESEGFIRFIRPNALGVGTTVTIGYQCGHYVFIGAGGGCIMNFDGDEQVEKEDRPTFPVYGDIRLTLNKKTTPFIDAQYGHAFGNANGTYFKASLGCRIGFGNDKAFNISLGWSYRPYMYYHYYRYNYYKDLDILSTLSMTIGFEL